MTKISVFFYISINLFCLRKCKTCLHHPNDVNNYVKEKMSQLQKNMWARLFYGGGVDCDGIEIASTLVFHYSHH